MNSVCMCFFPGNLYKSMMHHGIRPLGPRDREKANPHNNVTNNLSNPRTLNPLRASRPMTVTNTSFTPHSSQHWPHYSEGLLQQISTLTFFNQIMKNICNMLQSTSTPFLPTINKLFLTAIRRCVFPRSPTAFRCRIGTSNEANESDPE